MLVYMIDDDEVYKLDVNDIEGMHEVMDTIDENTQSYYEPLKINKVNIITESSLGDLGMIESSSCRHDGV